MTTFANDKPFLAMQPHQFVVDADRRAAGRQTQHARLPAGRPVADHRRDLAGDIDAGIVRIVEARVRTRSRRVMRRQDQNRAAMLVHSAIWFRPPRLVTCYP